MYNNEHFAQPPPAHMGIPPVHIDPKSGEKIIVNYTTTTKSPQARQCGGLEERVLGGENYCWLFKVC